MLFVGRTTAGSNAADWISCFEMMGFEVDAIELWPQPNEYGRLERSIAYRTNYGRPIERINKKILSSNINDQYDIVWIVKGVWLFPETIAFLKKRADTLVHFSLDSHFYENRSRHLFASIPLYDVMVTTKSFEVYDYWACGAHHVECIPQFYSQRIEHFRPDFGAIRPIDVAFIGHYQKHYYEVLASLSRRDCKLAIWGPNWGKHISSDRLLHGAYRGEGLWGDDYPKAINSSKISLGLLSKRIPEVSTTRTVEIPASGGFLLAERSSEHLQMFEANKEAVYFSNLSELGEQVSAALNDGDLRLAIAQAGYRKAQRYSSQAVLGSLLTRLGYAIDHKSFEG